MHRKYNFYLFDLQEFQDWIHQQRITRTITRIQQHHTFIPDYSHFTGSNHFTLQRNMRNHHVGNNGWSDIGQHFSIFPDGTIVTGRSLEKIPACIYGANANAICIENVGNFDSGEDEMTTEQAKAIIHATAILCDRFNVKTDANGIIYHHWYNLANGHRHNGDGISKSCPGTGFFGGNKLSDFENNFLPQVKATLSHDTSEIKPKKYVSVTASRLNVRTGPGTNHSRATVVDSGAILRVFAEKDGWLKISNSSDRWVYARFTKDLERANTTASVLNVRTGPGTNFAVAGTLPEGSEVFIEKRQGQWAKINLLDQWLHANYLKFA